MSPGFVGLLIPLLVCGGIYLWQINRMANAFPAQADAKLARLNASAAQTRLDLARASYGLKPEAAGRDTSSPTPDARDREAASFAAFLANPTVQNLPASLPPSIAQHAVDQDYAGLFSQLQLPPEQSDALRQLLVKRENVAFDAINTARTQGINPLKNSAQFAALVAQGHAAADLEIHALLGDQGFQAFQDFNRRNPRLRGATPARD
jgi:hypothetical protein